MMQYSIKIEYLVESATDKKSQSKNDDEKNHLKVDGNRPAIFP